MRILSSLLAHIQYELTIVRLGCSLKRSFSADILKVLMNDHWNLYWTKFMLLSNNILLPYFRHLQHLNKLIYKYYFNMLSVQYIQLCVGFFQNVRKFWYYL